MREITPLLQIRQVAHLVEHHMQPARAPRAKEHTNNPVQRPNFRGHATGDVEVTRDYDSYLMLKLADTVTHVTGISDFSLHSLPKFTFGFSSQ